MKHIETTSKLKRVPVRACEGGGCQELDLVAMLNQLVCQAKPDKEKCAEVA